MDELGRHKMFDDGFSTQLARGDNKFKNPIESLAIYLKTRRAPSSTGSLPMLVGSPAASGR